MNHAGYGDSVIGYQEPDVECHVADDDTVCRLLANDPAIKGLEVEFEPTEDRGENEDESKEMVLGEDNWGMVTGMAISRSTHLRKLRVSTESSKTLYVSDIFLKLVALNQSIEDLRLDCIYLETKMDISSIIALFFERNHNLRSVRFFGLSLPDSLF